MCLVFFNSKIVELILSHTSNWTSMGEKKVNSLFLTLIIKNLAYEESNFAGYVTQYDIPLPHQEHCNSRSKFPSQSL